MRTNIGLFTIAKDSENVLVVDLSNDADSAWAKHVGVDVMARANTLLDELEQMGVLRVHVAFSGSGDPGPSTK